MGPGHYSRELRRAERSSNEQFAFGEALTCDRKGANGCGEEVGALARLWLRAWVAGVSGDELARRAAMKGERGRRGSSAEEEEEAGRGRLRQGDGGRAA
jgi:hypothetical protein